MNLYKVLVEHFSQKDNVLAIVEYLLARNDDDVYNHIGKHNCERWADAERDGDVCQLYDDDYNIIGTETNRERIMRRKGEVNDDDIDLSDAYYGVTVYGWELVEEDVTWDATHLIACGMIVECEAI